MEYGRHVVEVSGRSGPGWVKWYAVCSCGYRAVVRRTEELAWDAGAHHLVKMARQDRENGGVRLPPRRGGRLRSGPG